MNFRPAIDHPWESHNSYLHRHPAIQGTPLAENGCPGTLIVDSHIGTRAFTVRCDNCWRCFAVGPPRVAA